MPTLFLKSTQVPGGGDGMSTGTGFNTNDVNLPGNPKGLAANDKVKWFEDGGVPFTSTVNLSNPAQFISHGPCVASGALGPPIQIDHSGLAGGVGFTIPNNGNSFLGIGGKNAPTQNLLLSGDENKISAAKFEGAGSLNIKVNSSGGINSLEYLIVIGEGIGSDASSFSLSVEGCYLEYTGVGNSGRMLEIRQGRANGNIIVLNSAIALMGIYALDNIPLRNNTIIKKLGQAGANAIFHNSTVASFASLVNNHAVDFDGVGDVAYRAGANGMGVFAGNAHWNCTAAESGMDTAGIYEPSQLFDPNFLNAAAGNYIPQNSGLLIAYVLRLYLENPHIDPGALSHLLAGVVPAGADHWQNIARRGGI